MTKLRMRRQLSDEKNSHQRCNLSPSHWLYRIHRHFTCVTDRARYTGCLAIAGSVATCEAASHIDHNCHFSEVASLLGSYTTSYFAPGVFHQDHLVLPEKVQLSLKGANRRTPVSIIICVVGGVLFHNHPLIAVEMV
jgi:hypothetical protein